MTNQSLAESSHYTRTLQRARTHTQQLDRVSSLRLSEEINMLKKTSEPELLGPRFLPAL